MDTHSYKGWLNSDKLWKRALGVWGHALVGSLIIWSIFLLYMLIRIFLG